jgi:unsaturated chondroitin disaccharide hydrolase
MSYDHTREPRYLEAAIKTADFFISQLPEDYVPHWDFRAPRDSNTPRDTSAASCAASGMLLLSELVDDGELKAHYAEVATQMLKSLSERYATFDNPSEQGLLTGGAFNCPQGLGINCSLIYGDYYYVEGMSKLVDKTN